MGDDNFSGFMGAVVHDAPNSNESARQFLDDDIVSVTRDPRLLRRRKAAEEEHLKAPFIKSLLNYLADKSLLETQAIHDTIVGEAWTTLYEIRLRKAAAAAPPKTESGPGQ